MAVCLAGSGLQAQAAGFLPVSDAVRPLEERLALIDQELGALRPLLRPVSGPQDSRQALRERALAWARVQVLQQEQAQLKVELVDAHRAAEDPMRLH
ncbi:MAG TPA: hypothetical protein VK195_12595 [Burkholderiaceae bacterium]|nr:hypothetical protein [Burkholderiaceae bacterium]